MPVKIKICGITRVEDAAAAVEAGADALGFMLYNKSKRFVTLEQAASIASTLPPFVTRVGVMVNPDEKDVRLAISEAGMNCIQFHGDEPPDWMSRFPVPAIKGFRIRDRESLIRLPQYDGAAAWLLDSFVAGELGGTGHQFNWDLAIEASKAGKPIILAGGINPQNIAQAIDRVQPYAIDLASGVESSPGIKDHQKIRDLMKAVHAC